MSANAKQQLVNLVIHKAMDPVMHKKPDGLSEADQKKLDHVQKATEAEIDRYRNYGSAEEVVTNFRRDLHSTAAKKIHGELDALGLPTINDIRDEFEQKAEELGVK